MSGEFSFRLATLHYNITRHMAETDCRTYLRILLCASVCLCCVCVALWVNLFSRCPESMNDMLMHSGLIQTTPGKWSMKEEKNILLFSQTSNSSTWIVGCRKKCYKRTHCPSQEKHPILMVLPNGYGTTPQSVIDVKKVTFEQQSFTLCIRRTLTLNLGSAQINRAIHSAVTSLIKRRCGFICS